MIVGTAREHKRLIDFRRYVTSPPYHESNERRNEIPVIMVRLKLDTNDGTVVLTRWQAQETNSRDLNSDTLAGQDVAIRLCEYAKFVNLATF